MLQRHAMQRACIRSMLQRRAMQRPWRFVPRDVGWCSSFDEGVKWKSWNLEQSGDGIEVVLDVRRVEQYGEAMIVFEKSGIEVVGAKE